MKSTGKVFTMKRAILIFPFCLPLLYIRMYPVLYGLSVASGSFLLFENTPKQVRTNKKPARGIAFIFGSIILIFAEAVLRLYGFFKMPEWHNIQYYIPYYSLVIYYIAGIVLYRMYNREEKASEVREKKNTIKKIILVLLPTYISNIIYSFLHPGSWPREWSEFSSAVFQIIVVAAIMEEFFFRGFLYSSMKAYLGVVKATIFSSAVFTLHHLNVLSTLFYSDHTINTQCLQQLLIIFILGVVNCIAFERSKRLLLPILYHIVNAGALYFTISYLLA